jgi:hypothetical protein
VAEVRSELTPFQNIKELIQTEKHVKKQNRWKETQTRRHSERRKDRWMDRQIDREMDEWVGG